MEKMGLGEGILGAGEEGKVLDGKERVVGGRRSVEVNGKEVIGEMHMT